MTEQVKRFCDKYFETLNGTQSAIYAGFSEKTARSQASQMLDTDQVQEYLDQLRVIYQEKTGISTLKVLNEIARLSFSDIREYYTEDGSLKNIKELSDDAAAALAGVEVDELFEWVDGQKVSIGHSKKVKIYDKLAALEKLARHLGIYAEDNNQSKPITQQIFKIGDKEFTL